jgi:hypothetical protein
MAPRAILVDLHCLDVGVQADVAHHSRLLERERLHLGGEVQLAACAIVDRREVVAALLAEPGAADGYGHHDREDRSEPEREAGPDFQLA